MLIFCQRFGVQPPLSVQFLFSNPRVTLGTLKWLKGMIIAAQAKMCVFIQGYLGKNRSYGKDVKFKNGVFVNMPGG